VFHLRLLVLPCTRHVQFDNDTFRPKSLSLDYTRDWDASRTR